MIPFLLALATVAQAEVVSIIDGDTLKVRTAKEEIKVRLGCIDAMERSQPGGVASALALKALLTPGDPVEILVDKTDMYGRSIALVWSGSNLINLKQVSNGSAVIYSQYFRPCLDLLQDFNQAQKKAEELGNGFWSLPPTERIYPWIWRKEKRSKY